MSAEAELMDGKQPEGFKAGEADARPPWRATVLWALTLGTLLGIVYLSPLRTHLGRLREMSEYLKGLGWLAPVVLTLSVAVLVGVGFPRLALCVVAGMALGFWSGLLWAQLGTLLGNYVAFLVVRLGSREWAQRYISRHGKFHGLVRREGIAGVILARQMPLPGLLINLACGLLDLRQRDYLIGTVIGQLPAAVPCTLVGAGVLQASFRRSLGVIGLAVVIAVLAWVALRHALRVQKRSRAPAGDTALTALPEPSQQGNRPSPQRSVQ
jgi:uncharacterized membrane protein YdjX (TVP38/TMEM64 family)